MFTFTNQERKVLIFIGLLILIGSILKFFNLSAIEESLSSGKDNAVVEEVRSVRLVNINQAPLKDLETIPGIGIVTAGKIIDYRNQFGPFRDFEDLQKVKGIGSKKIEAIKRQVKFK